MNKKAVELPRKQIKDYPEKTNTATDKLIQDIIDRTNHVAVNKIDEVEVMQCMLNDKDFKIAQYDKKKGYTGVSSPREDALELAVSALCDVTGMNSDEAKALTEDYQFSKKDAERYINISKDFVSTYLQSGRKLQLTSDPRGEAVVSLKYVEGKVKSVPDREKGGTKTVKTADSIKLVAANKR